MRMDLEVACFIGVRDEIGCHKVDRRECRARGISHRAHQAAALGELDRELQDSPIWWRCSCWPRSAVARSIC
jgi:hypothetical protein